jgi:hypothetical protein
MQTMLNNTKYAARSDTHLKISSPSATIKKSTFVSVIAIIFILHSSATIVISLFRWMADPEALLDTFKDAQDDLFLALFVIMMLLMFALSIFTLISSVGLLFRKQWSRIAFITSMSINIVLKISLLAAATKIFYFMPDVSHATELKKYALYAFIELIFSLLHAFMFIIYIGTVTYSITSIGISIWLIHRFMSEKIKQAFHRSN